MNVDIIIKNYRCFSDNKPARISLREGFTSLLGVNNSGKSSLLRFFYELRPLFQQLSNPHAGIHNAIQGRAVGFNAPSPVTDIAELFCYENDRPMELEFILPSPTSKGVANAIERVVVTLQRNSNDWALDLIVDGKLINKNENNHINNVGLSVHTNGQMIDIDVSSVYDLFTSLSKTMYIGSFRNIVNIGASESYYDISIGQSFITSWKTFKNGQDRKTNQAMISLESDIKHIFNFDDLQINTSADEQNLHLFVDRRSYRLNELGSGIAQFIIVLANAAFRHMDWILIDEPELNLHPSLQLDFLTTLGSYARQGVIFATHSVGLARSASERIYSLRKAKGSTSEVLPFESTPRPGQFLGELGFSGYQELGFDKILLVEGYHDVKVIQQFLRVYGKDHQVVLMPLGGKTLIKGDADTELLEIKRISENVHALIDSERTVLNAPLEPERQAFMECCKRNNIPCHILKRRATENYLTERAVQYVKGDNYHALEEYQARNEVKPVWSKAENWRIAREMTRVELDLTDLGKFLAAI